jgi:RimJ/RimL family protein N-acetyltransferase
VIAQSARLELHRFGAAQLATVTELLCDPEVARQLFVEWSPEHGLAGNGPRFQRNFAQAWERHGFGGCLFHRRGDPLAIGFVALKPHRAGGAEVPGAFEIYFGLARKEWGRGIGTEAVRAYLAELERRLAPASIHASIDAPQNPAGCRVLEKLGFGFERHVPLAEFAGGSLARGSLELEIWRLAQPAARPETLDQAAFRVGQLLDAAGVARAEAETRLIEAAQRGAVGGSLPAAERERRLCAALEAGRADARYAVYRRT